jgi:hypothetical protein
MAGTRQTKQEQEKLAKQAEYNILKTQAGCNAIQDKPDLFTLTFESDNISIDFYSLEHNRLRQVEHELLHFLSSLRIIESTITITKEEQE